MFSVGILSLVIVGILLLVVQAIDISRRINYEYTGTNLAKMRLEDARVSIKTNGFNTLSDLAEGSEKRINEDGIPDKDGEFTRKTTISPDYNSSALLTEAKVEIRYYFKGKKKAAPITMTTVFSQLES
jgi:23S rRNA A1618 N6-methylase RlmF